MEWLWPWDRGLGLDRACPWPWSAGLGLEWSGLVNTTGRYRLILVPVQYTDASFCLKLKQRWRTVSRIICRIQGDLWHS